VGCLSVDIPGRLFDKVAHRVHAQAVEAEIEPVAGDVFQFLADFPVAEIKVGHAGPEGAVIIRTAGTVMMPGVGSAHRIPEAVFGAPQVPVVLAVHAVGRKYEPGMRGRGVVRHKVEDNLHAFRVGGSEEFGEILFGAEKGIYCIVVGGVVAVHVVAGGGSPQSAGENGRKPDRVAADFVLDVIELFSNAVEVPAAVTRERSGRGIGERLYPNVIKGRIALPAGAKTRRLIFQVRCLDHRMLRACIRFAAGQRKKRCAVGGRNDGDRFFYRIGALAAGSKREKKDGGGRDG